MMKTLFKIVGALVVIVVIAIVVLVMNLDRGIKAAVEEFGPRYTGTPVTLDKVSLSLRTGEGSLGGLTVGNPAGFQSTEAFRLGSIDVALNTDTLNKEPVNITAIRIVAPEITYEKNRQGNNLALIQQHVKEATGAGSGVESAGQEDDSEGKKMIIDELSLTGAIVHYSNPLLGNQVLDLRLPDIHLYDIGKKSGGATGAEVTAQVLNAVYSQVNKAIANSDQVKALTEQVQGKFKAKEDELKGKLEGLKGLFGKE